MKVADLPSSIPLTIDPSSRIEHVRKIMTDHKLRHVPVVTGGCVVGILSDRDLLLHEGQARGANAGTLPVVAPEARPATLAKHIMSAPVWCVDVDSDPCELIDMLLEYRISAVPLVKGDSLLGILTTSDLLRWYVDFCQSGTGDRTSSATAAAYMRQAEVTCDVNDSVRGVLENMTRTGSDYAVVMASNRLAGIISDRDLRRHLGVTTRGNASRLRTRCPVDDAILARQIMTANPRTASPDASLPETAWMMLLGRFGALPIVSREGTFEGLLTTTDLMRAVRETVQRENAVAV